MVGGRIVEAVVHLIRPPTREFRFSYIHGLEWADVAEADDFGALWPKLAELLDGATFLAAHNATFDRRVLETCCATYGLAAPTLPFRCTVQLARRHWSIYPTRLPDVCRVLGIALDHHEALSDARACAAIVLATATRACARRRNSRAGRGRQAVPALRGASRAIPASARSTKGASAPANIANHPKCSAAFSGGTLTTGRPRALADDPGDVAERHALLGDGVIAATRDALFEREAVGARRVEPMHGRPAVQPLADIGSGAFFSRAMATSIGTKPWSPSP